MEHDRFFCHLGPFFALLPTQQLQKSNFEKVKKIPGDINLQMCTKNEDHIMYGS